MRVHPTVTLGGSLDTQVGFREYDNIAEETEDMVVAEVPVDEQHLVEEIVENYRECDVL